MKPTNFKIILVLLLLILPCEKLTSAEVIDSIAAIVDTEIILESEISYGVNTILLEQNIRFPDAKMLAEYRDQVLNAYISQKVLLAKAEEETLMVEGRLVDKELEKKLDQMIQQVGSKEKLVEYFDRPLRKIKFEMRQGVHDQLIVEMLKQRELAGIHISRNEVVEFYRERTEELPRLPERVQLSHIMLEVKASDEARIEALGRIGMIYDYLADGLNFDSLASVFSDDPSSVNGGRLGFTDRNDLVPEYEEVAYSLEPGEISEIVESQFGLHIIRLIERQGERISSQHILVSLKPVENDWLKVNSLAVELRKRIDEGEEFGELAAEYSNDEESAIKGGKLLPLPLNDLPADFKYIVDELEAGDISDPVRTAYGYHLVRLDELIPEKRLSLQEDWQTIEQFALNFKRESNFQDWIETLKKDHYIWPSKN